MMLSGSKALMQLHGICSKCGPSFIRRPEYGQFESIDASETDNWTASVEFVNHICTMEDSDSSTNCIQIIYTMIGVAMFCHQSLKTSDHDPTARGGEADRKSNIEDISQHKLSVAPMMEYTGR